MSISSQIRLGFLAVLLTTSLPVLVGCSKGEKEEVRKSSDSKESPNVKTIDGTRETLLSVTANVPRLLNEIERRAPGNPTGDAEFMMANKLVGQMGIDELHILLVSPKGNSLTPVVMIPDPTGKIWDSLQNGELSAFFEKTKDNSLRPKTEMAGDSTQLPTAVKKAVFRSVDRYVVAAEPALLDRIENDEWSPEKELAFQFVEKNKLPNSLVTVGIALPKKLPDSLGSMFSKEDLAAAGPAGQIGLGIVDSIYDQVREVAKAREAIAVSFQFEGNDGRQLKVAQQFVTPEAAKSAKQLISEPTVAVAESDGLTKSLLAALNNDKLNRKLESGERSLHLTLSWKAADDQALSMHLKQAAMSGEMTGLGMGAGVTPTEGPIFTRYENSPNLLADIDKESLEKQLTKELSQRLFPRSGFSGDAMSVELDPIATPNVGLKEFDSKVMIEVTSVTTSDEKEVVANTTPQECRFHHENQFAVDSIRVKVKEGVEGDQLQNATLRFDIPIAHVLHMFTVKADDIGETLEQEGVSFTLNKLARDTATGVYKGFTADEDNKVHFFARDSTGGWLARSMWSGGGGNWYVRFAGEIDELTVVMTDGQPIVVSPVVTVDLNGGEQIDMPSDPTDNMPSRYTITNYRKHESTDESSLDDIEVALEKSSRRPNLTLTLPPTATAGQSRWEVNKFGATNSMFLAGHGFGGFDNVVQRWQSHEKEALMGAGAIFGVARIVIPTDIETVMFEKQADGQWIPHELAGGQKIEVMIDKQIVTFSLADTTLLGMRVMDDTGETLKSGRTDQDDEGRRREYYWGHPTRIELHIAARIIDRTIPFEFIEGQVDQSKLAAFKSEVADRRAVANQLLRIQGLLSDRSNKLDDIAGLHFFHDANGRPMNSIPLEVAQACPQSAERFGYTAKPFHGYYFKLFEETSNGDKTIPFDRASSTRKVKWDKGEVEFKPYWGRLPSAYAVPTESGRDVLVTQWGQVYARDREGLNLKVQPDNMEGWTEIKPLDENPVFQQFQSY